MTGKPTRIIRTARDKSHPYQMIHTGFANDKRLSVETRGAMVYLLTKPDHWKIIPEALRKELGVGRDKMYRMLDEMTSAGYLHRERTRDDKGRIAWGDYVLYENPADAPPLPENPDMDNPYPAQPYTENQEMDKTAVLPVAEPSAPFPGLPYTENQDAYISTDRVITEKQRIDPPPPTPSSDAAAAAPPLAAGGGGGATGPGRNPHPAAAEPPGVTYLRHQGFSPWAMRTFGHYPVEVLSREWEAARANGTKQGGMVDTWKLCPPGSTPPPGSAAPPPRAALTRELVLTTTTGKDTERWLRRLRAEGADRAALLAEFITEYPDAQRPRGSPAGLAPALRP